LGKKKLCLGLELEHKSNGILVHQSAYIDRLLKHIDIDKAHPLSTPMVVRSLDPQMDLFRPKEPHEDILGLEAPYLNTNEGLKYLTHYMRPDIALW